MKLPSLAILLLAALSSNGCIKTTNALVSNPQELPQLLSDTVCSSAQGRTASCEVELDVPASCITNTNNASSSSSSSSSSDCPIVFFFHGAGGTNDWFARTSGVHSQNAIGVYPQGENGWNTGPKDSNTCSWDDYGCTSDPDEGAFIAGIISELRNLGANGNIYLIGNSNGAALSMRLASNAGDDLPIKGVVTKVTQLLAQPPRSGPGDLNYNQPGSGGPKVSILNIMGTSDMVIPYEGGTSSVFGGDVSFQLMSALESMATWASHNECGADGTPPIISDGVHYSTNADPNGVATFYEYQGCPEGVIMEHYALHGAGHSLGAGAALDGIAIDNDLAFEFIARLEQGTDGGPPSTASPVMNLTPAPSSASSGQDSTPVPTTSPVLNSGCEDDPDWRGKFNTAHDCASVGEAPEQRCGWESSDGTLASVACKESCDECETVVTSGPTSEPTSKPTPEPTPAPSSTCIPGCSDTATPWMVDTKGWDCATAPNWLMKTNCRLDTYWVKNLFCEMRCQATDGVGYHDTSCCSSTI
eukprot:CAMPEP_0172299846 /NCGR_PEP_ID=MMETSP1058-20130122/2041_1 /TAXON_ID=83371 /ORGANISM="Detonula confervacea, Strain CCMP 353" /LENGTH=529 /DNA_ID=CAMNT_0013009417 /DNA_START=14 /DNA_END=1603 /DNA_ORIENTATION=-